jgi:hypothetical protein
MRIMTNLSKAITLEILEMMMTQTHRDSIKSPKVLHLLLDVLLHVLDVYMNPLLALLVTRNRAARVMLRCPRVPATEQTATSSILCSPCKLKLLVYVLYGVSLVLFHLLLRISHLGDLLRSREQETCLSFVTILMIFIRLY